jgi:hypothetical protein
MHSAVAVDAAASAAVGWRAFAQPFGFVERGVVPFAVFARRCSFSCQPVDGLFPVAAASSGVPDSVCWPAGFVAVGIACRPRRGIVGLQLPGVAVGRGTRFRVSGRAVRRARCRCRARFISWTRFIIGAELDNYAFVPCLSALQPTAEKHERELKNPSMASQGFHRDLG